MDLQLGQKTKLNKYKRTESIRSKLWEQLTTRHGTGERDEEGRHLFPIIMPA